MKKEEIYASLNRAYFSDHSDEADVLERLAPLVAKVRCFVDVGASLGQYTLFANQHMKGGRIYSIEADPVRYEELERNCRKWAADSDNEIIPIHAAVGDSDGAISFYVTNSNVSGGLFIHPVKSPGVEWEEVQVPAIRLDSYFAEDIPDFIKMDVEGGELRALRGAPALLGQHRTTLFVEVHSWADPRGQRNQYEVYDFMESSGYKMKHISGRCLFEPR